MILFFVNNKVNKFNKHMLKRVFKFKKTYLFVNKIILNKKKNDLIV